MSALLPSRPLGGVRVWRESTCIPFALKQHTVQKQQRIFFGRRRHYLSARFCRLYTVRNLRIGPGFHPCCSMGSLKNLHTGVRQGRLHVPSRATDRLASTR
eukprot:scaffold2709_cov17-Prasinocladus_malaysianus.AAC.1